MIGGGLKKCVPRQRPGSGMPSKIAASDRRRSVGREHGLRAARRRHRGEQLPLEVDVLRHRLDHQVGVRHRGRDLELRAQVGEHGVLLLLRGLAARDPLVEERGDAGEAAIEELLLHVAHRDARAGRRADLRDAGAHGAGTDHDDTFESGGGHLSSSSAWPRRPRTPACDPSCPGCRTAPPGPRSRGSPRHPGPAGTAR